MGLLQLLTGAYIIHPVQLLFDYPLPYAVLRFCWDSLLQRSITTTGSKRMTYIWVATGIASSC